MSWNVHASILFYTFSFSRSFICSLTVNKCCKCFLFAHTQTMSVVNYAFDGKKQRWTRIDQKHNNKKTYKAERPFKNHFERNGRKGTEKITHTNSTCIDVFSLFLMYILFLSVAYMTVSILIAYYIFHVVCSATVSLLLVVRCVAAAFFHATSG